MAHRFLDERGRSVLLDAVRAVEARSAAEVVVSVRERSGSYLHADLLAGILAGWAVLSFELFSAWEFSLGAILLSPALAGLLVALLTSRAPALRRTLTPAGMRAAAVRTAAAAAFHETGTSHTTGRTGLLVYLSLLERTAEVVADRGVLAAVPAGPWRVATERVRAGAAAGDPRAAADAIEGLGDVLERALPLGADDANELADEMGAA